MVGIRSFPFGMAYLQGRTVSFRDTGPLARQVSNDFVLASNSRGVKPTARTGGEATGAMPEPTGSPVVVGYGSKKPKGKVETSFAFHPEKMILVNSQTGWPLVGNEGINLYIGILGIHSLIPY